MTIFFFAENLGLHFEGDTTLALAVFEMLDWINRATRVGNAIISRSHFLANKAGLIRTVLICVFQLQPTFG